EGLDRLRCPRQRDRAGGRVGARRRRRRRLEPGRHGRLRAGAGPEPGVARRPGRRSDPGRQPRPCLRRRPRPCRVQPGCPSRRSLDGAATRSGAPGPPAKSSLDAGRCGLHPDTRQPAGPGLGVRRRRRRRCRQPRCRRDPGLPGGPQPHRARRLPDLGRERRRAPAATRWRHARPESRPLPRQPWQRWPAAGSRFARGLRPARHRGRHPFGPPGGVRRGGDPAPDGGGVAPRSLDRSPRPRHL
ncbi:MAG: hypothetical protein AVDCRST_MAG19-438, partial [uncultured Thermomicrobiales bacterium]